MKGLLLILVLAMVYYYGFYESKPEPVEQQWPKQRPGLAVLPDKTEEKKQWSSDKVLQGYQDKVQRAKDMEKVVLKAAEQQKKTISDATN